MEFQMEQSPVLIVGGLGKTGRRVAERLKAQERPVRIASRSTDPRFDWKDRSSWAEALRGASAVYATYQPDLAVPGAVDDIAEFARMAKTAGISRIVLLSGRGEDGAVASEQALQASGVDCTILRASWFAQNFSEAFFLEGVLAGELALPVGDVPEPFVDVDDIADVAAAALTNDRHSGQTYELTGPQPLTFAEAVLEIANAAGRPIRYTPVAWEIYAAELARTGVPDDFAALMHELFTEVLDGRNSRPMDGVERARGSPPRSFADDGRDAAKTGSWGARQ
jgi:uncharacterized protein YbjT (DUF2867 family)